MSIRLTGAETAGFCCLLFRIMQHIKTSPVIMPPIRTTPPAAMPTMTPVDIIGAAVDVLDAAVDNPVEVPLAPESLVLTAPVPVAAAVMIVF